MSKATIKVLGTNGWYTSETGNTTCVLIETDTCYIICDAGNGIRHIDEHIKNDQKPIFLFISHFHFDHITGLHILNKFKFPQGMTICCFEGGEDLLNTIINHPFTVPLKDLPTKIDIRELSEGRHEGFPFELECQEIKHIGKCFGYRFDFGGKIISYCTDTGYCQPVIDLSKDADVLITECAFKTDGMKEDWPHLNPALGAKMAKEAGVKKLLLIHFDAEVYDELEDRKIAEKKAQDVFPETQVAEDGLEVTI